MAQERELKEVLRLLNKAPNELEKRLAYLEKAEYSKLNYYAATYLAVGQILAATPTIIVIPNMISSYLKGFTLASSVLTCVEPGMYVVNYSQNILLSGTTSLKGFVFKNGVADLGSWAQGAGVSGDFITLSATSILSLDATDTVDLRVGFTPIGVTVARASLTLNRVGDNT